MGAGVEVRVPGTRGRRRVDARTCQSREKVPPKVVFSVPASLSLLIQVVQSVSLCAISALTSTLRSCQNSVQYKRTKEQNKTSPPPSQQNLYPTVALIRLPKTPGVDVRSTRSRHHSELSTPLAGPTINRMIVSFRPPDRLCKWTKSSYDLGF